MNAMTLDPATYACPDHQTDLTALVTEALEDDDTPRAYWQLRLPGRAAPQPRRFEVTVTCPGTAASGAHELVCAGTRTR